MIKISNSDRVTIVGATGSGKTVLAKFLLQQCNRVIVIDPKHTFRLEGFRPGWGVPNFKKEFHVVIRPRRGDDSKLALAMIEAIKKRDVTIYIDELAVIEERYPEALSVLKEIALTGRERHVALWSALQRPRGVPRLFFTESEVFFIFNLRNADDRSYIAGYVGDEVKEQIPRHEFWYFRGEEDSPRLMHLDLKKDKVFEVQPTNTERSLQDA